MPVLMLCDLLVKQMLRDRTFPKLSTTDHKAQGDVFLPLIGVNINFTTARICRFREVMFSTVCLFTGGGEGVSGAIGQCGDPTCLDLLICIH